MSKQPSYDFIKMIQEGTLDVVEWLALQDEESIRERVYERVQIGRASCRDRV